MQALRCIADLVVRHPANRDLLGSKVIGEEPDTEPALNCVLRALLNATNLSECIAAEYVVKCYCEVFFLIRSTSMAVCFKSGHWSILSCLVVLCCHTVCGVSVAFITLWKF